MARLIHASWPEFGGEDQPPPRPDGREYAERVESLRAAMRSEGFTHLAVYGDREHFANLAWLTGFDPRFEEALLILRDNADPLVLAGNECMNYLPASPLVQQRLLRSERYQHFSPPDQPRDASRPLERILREEGIGAHSRVGVAGWKSYDHAWKTDVPSYIVDALRFAAGWENVANAAHLFQDPERGLRATASATDIAFFEWTNTLASEGMKRVLRAIRPGALDFELLEEARYNGVPLGCHMTLKCGANRVSLASARGERAERGGRFSCGICYWGANVCRCGWVAESEADLPPEARDYVEAFAGPYFDAMAAWFAALRIGSTGGALHDAIHARLPFEKFHVFLNAGHLIHLDEWVSSPAYANSQIPLRSGMVMQADVIPSHPLYYSSRMEDGYVLADETLQSELRTRFPALIARCESRRAWMQMTLGLPLSPDVLPLSNLCGIVPPYLLAPETLLAADWPRPVCNRISEA
jgi:Xaa-Pro aminopeptidase